jgi:membrane protein
LPQFGHARRNRAYNTALHWLNAQGSPANRTGAPVSERASAMAVDALNSRDLEPSWLVQWRDKALRLWARVGEHRVMLIAAGVTYYLLLALVPTLSVFVSLYGLVADRSKVLEQVAMLDGVIPPGAADILRDQLTRLISAPPGALSVTLIGSLLVALWSSSAGVKALFDAMNVAYGEDEKRNFFLLNGVALLFTLCGVLAAGVVVSAVLILPAVLNMLLFGLSFGWLVQALGYLVMLAVLFVGISSLYRWGPTARKTKWRWFSPGTLLGVIATVLVSVLFSWYASNFSNYNAAYGSLGALIGMLTWLWLTVIVLIMGAELNAESEERHLGRTAAPAVGVTRTARRDPGHLALGLLLVPAALLALAERRHPRG